jgi:hypothetical protein
MALRGRGIECLVSVKIRAFSTFNWRESEPRMNTINNFIESLLLNFESRPYCFDVSHTVESGCVEEPVWLKRQIIIEHG